MLFDDYWTEGLSDKQQELIRGYVLNQGELPNDLGGYKKRGSALAFLRSKKGRIAKRRYVEFLLDTKTDEIKLKIIPIWFRRAFFNPADIINADGELIIRPGGTDLRDLGDLAYCIDGIETMYTKSGDKCIKIKLCSREKALDVLSKLFDLYKKEDITQGSIGKKSVFEMTDEERDKEMKELLAKSGILQIEDKTKNE